MQERLRQERIRNRLGGKGCHLSRWQAEYFLATKNKGTIYLTFLTPMDCGFSLWATATDCGWEVKYIDPKNKPVIGSGLRSALCPAGLYALSFSRSMHNIKAGTPHHWTPDPGIS